MRKGSSSGHAAFAATCEVCAFHRHDEKRADEGSGEQHAFPHQETP